MCALKIRGTDMAFVKLFGSLLLAISTCAYAIEPSIEFVPTDKTAAGYAVQLKGMPNKEVYITSNLSLEIPIPGQFIAAQLTTKADPLNATYYPLTRDLLGERIHYRVYSKDWQLLAENSIVPREISVDSKRNTFKVRAELIDIIPTRYELFLDKINKEERVRVKNNSYAGEVAKVEYASDEHNHIAYHYVEDNNLKIGGFDTLTFERKNGDTAELKLNWGNQILYEWEEHENYPRPLPVKLVTFTAEPAEFVAKLQFQGLEAGNDYAIVALSYSIGEFKKLASFDVLENGRYRINGKEVGALGISTKDLILGEPVYLVLMNKEEVVLGIERLVLRPLQATSAMGTLKMNARFLGVKPSRYHLSFEGVNGSEKILFQSTSGAERSEWTNVVSEDSIIDYMPGVITDTGGVAHIKITRANGDTLSMDIPWGDTVFEEVAFRQKQIAIK